MFLLIGLLSSFPDVMTIFYEKPMCTFLTIPHCLLNWLILGYSKITQQIAQMGKWEITVHIVSYFFQILLKTEGSRPNTASKALKECDDDLFTNIYALLKIWATIPATSCECERSASSLRRLHTYNRACMGQERLSSLALMHIHYQVKIVLDEVVNLFATKHPRRLELRTILRD